MLREGELSLLYLDVCNQKAGFCSQQSSMSGRGGKRGRLVEVVLWSWPSSPVARPLAGASRLFYVCGCTVQFSSTHCFILLKELALRSALERGL